MFAVVEQSNKEACVGEDWQRRRRKPYQSHLPLPCLSTRHFFPKPSLCFLLVARSPGPKLTQPMPISRGRGLAVSCSASFRMDSRTACDGVQPLARTNRFSAASDFSSNRTCTVAPISPLYYKFAFCTTDCFCLLPRLRPLIHPVVDGLPPQAGVLGLEDPVAFVGEVEHLRRHLEQLQRVEELEAFAHIQTIIELTVDDEGGGLEVFSRHHRRPLAEGILGVGLAVVVPRGAPQAPAPST